MRSTRPGMPQTVSYPLRLMAAASVALLIAGCSSSGASPVVVPTATPTPVVTDTPMSTVAGVTATPVATATPAPTASATAVATPHGTPTPLPALAIGLCISGQLKAQILYWTYDSGSGTDYAHLQLSNASSATCSVRGTYRAQILNGGGSVIADSGSSSVEVKSSDPVYSLAPNDILYVTIMWSNWCHSAPAQKLKVSLVEPFGLGRMVAPANGVAPVPTCTSSGSKTLVVSQPWFT